ncbi:hypothetical protein C0J52_02805 [Blattella germanica]|nr:hypothetical protein C0J52_02805 [Blattella germanica]
MMPWSHERRRLQRDLPEGIRMMVFWWILSLLNCKELVVYFPCPAPWLSGLRQCALVPGRGTRAGSSPRGGRNFLMDFGQCMGPVPTQHHEESGELRLVADSCYGY